jgi:hypothetical protein
VSLPNRISPRQAAVALISRAIDEADDDIGAHRRNARDVGSLYHSQIIVFLEQVREELRTAARLLEEHVDPPGD